MRVSVPVGITAVVADVAAYTVYTPAMASDDDDDDVITVWGQLSRSTVTAAAAAATV